jgi:hypothetical protein
MASTELFQRKRKESLMSVPGRSRVNRFATRTCLLFVLAAMAACLGAASAGAAIQIESFNYETAEPGGATTLRSGAHPDQTVATFDFAKDSEGTPLESPNNVSVELPLGAVGNPTSLSSCTDLQLVNYECPVGSQVGIVAVTRATFGVLTNPLYNLVAPPGTLAQFGFNVVGTDVHLVATVHSLPAYGITITARKSPQSFPFYKVQTTFWGVPASRAHDELRGFCAQVPPGSGCEVAPEGTEAPFLTNPSACSVSSPAVAQADSWLEPGVFAEAMSPTTSESGEPLGISGCALPDFSPTVEARPTTATADSPTGLHVNVRLPQDEAPKGLAEAQLRDATLVLPQGMTVNPASAAGLQACTPDQVGLVTAVGDPDARFDESAVTCPEASKLGTVQIKTPVLKEPFHGAIYLASQDQNPFGSLLALYIVLEDPQTGVIIKIPGEASADPQSGQLTVTFRHSPQLPFEDLDVELFEGSRAALKTPLACGTYTTQSTFVPWTAPEGPERHPTDSFRVNAPVGAGACPTTESAAPNSPGFLAGTVNPAAGVYSPFSLEVSRADGTQPFKIVEATLPPGLLGKLAGISYCPEASLAAAASRRGGEELASPSCPASSQVGSVTVGAGAGTTPLYVGGKVYLAGPYKGAPVSLAIITPAVAGPFDLGTVVVRSALNIDPVTTQIHVVSDPIPTILKGIPLDLRSIEVNLDRPEFTLNPTNCTRGTINANTVSVFNQNASLSNPFDAGDCGSLKFEPKLSTSTQGKTSKADGASLNVKLVPPHEGPQSIGSVGSASGTSGSSAQTEEANIARVKVELPKQLPSRLTTLQKACIAATFEANPATCPSASVIGHATVNTPLLPVPLTGPAYFVSHGGEAFPSLEVVLQGDAITVDLVGTTQIKGGITSTTFKTVPDVPFSSFELTLPQGKYSALSANGNLCKPTSTRIVKREVTVKSHGHKETVPRKVKEAVPAPLAMPTEFIAQNGAVTHQTTKISVTGCAKSHTVKKTSKKKPSKKHKKAK